MDDLHKLRTLRDICFTEKEAIICEQEMKDWWATSCNLQARDSAFFFSSLNLRDKSFREDDEKKGRERVALSNASRGGDAALWFSV